MKLLLKPAKTETFYGCPYIDVWFATQSHLRETQLRYWKEKLHLFIIFLKKARSKYAVVKSAISVNPVYMTSKPERSG